MKTTLSQFIVIETEEVGVAFLHMKGDIDPLVNAITGCFEQSADFFALVLTAMENFSSNKNISIEQIIKQAREM